MRDIVVMGGAFGSVLSLCRKIGRKYGVRCYTIVVNHKGSYVLNSSNCIEQSIDVEASTADELVAKMDDIYKAWKFREKPILYFGSDVCCMFVDERREWYAERFELCLPGKEIVNSFTRKGLAEVIAEKNGLKIPRTREIASKNDLEEVFSSFNFPVIIKPCSVLLKKGIDFKVKVLNKEIFLAECSELLEAGAVFLCQEYIPGNDDMSFYYIFYRSAAGKLVEDMGVKRLQSPPGQGIMAIGERQYDAVMATMSRQFLERINYTGIGGIEYKKFNNDYYFIEMSTRMEGFLMIGDVGSQSISLASYADINDPTSPFTTHTEKEDGTRFIDFLPFWTATKITRRFRTFIYYFTIGALSPKNRYNIISFRDPLPFLRMLWGMARFKMK